MIRHIAVLLVVFSPLSSFAQTKFYQCKDQWGQPVFSQRPCGSDSIEASVNVQEKISSATPGEEASDNFSTRKATAASHSSSELDETQSSWDRIKASNRLRDLEREIARREGQISTWENARDSRIAQLRSKKHYANNNLAGATWEESISTEMQAVSSQYDSKIDREQHKIDRLFKEKEELNEVL